MVILKNILLKLILIYKNIFSPYTGSVCRFEPTCSTYMHEAVSNMGVLKVCFLESKDYLDVHPSNLVDLILFLNYLNELFEVKLD